MIGSIRLKVNARRAANYLCLFGYALIAQMSVIMTATAESAETQSNATNAASIVTLGLDGTAWDKLLIWALTAAALVAGAVVVTTAGSIITHKREAEAAERDLRRYKETVAEKVAEARTAGIEAGKIAGNAEIRAGEANRQAGEANERAAQALARAESEALERIRLEAKFAWRRITKDQGNAAQNILSDHKSQVNVEVVANDPETSFYAMQIVKIFEMSGWTVNMSFPSYVDVVFVRSIIKKSDNGLDEIVLQALKAADLNFAIDEIPETGVSNGSPNYNFPVSILIVPKFHSE